MCASSKQALVLSRHERREELAFPRRPLFALTEHGLRKSGERLSEELGTMRRFAPTGASRISPRVYFPGSLIVVVGTVQSRRIVTYFDRSSMTLPLVLALVATLAPLSAAGSPDPQTSQERVSDPLLRNLRNLRGPGSSLGATVRDLTAAELDDQSLLNGAWIEEVRSNSPAARAELQVGDVVIEFDDELVRDVEQFRVLVRDTPRAFFIPYAVTPPADG